jgi:hypothetical protein
VRQNSARAHASGISLHLEAEEFQGAPEMVVSGEGERT